MIAAFLVALPLLHPERMALDTSPNRVLVPLPKSKPILVKVERATASASTPYLPEVLTTGWHTTSVPAMIARGGAAEDPPPMGIMGLLPGMGSALPTALASGGAGPRIAVVSGGRTASPGPVRVSSGVGAGMLMTPIRPVYPPIAQAARVEGVVVVEAVISREGRIERARVLTGPAMLSAAALAAVERARYTAYRLNGETVEVETMITVNFKLGG